MKVDLISQRPKKKPYKILFKSRGKPAWRRQCLGWKRPRTKAWERETSLGRRRGPSWREWSSSGLGVMVTRSWSWTCRNPPLHHRRLQSHHLHAIRSCVICLVFRGQRIICLVGGTKSLHVRGKNQVTSGQRPKDQLPRNGNKVTACPWKKSSHFRTEAKGSSAS